MRASITIRDGSDLIAVVRAALVINATDAAIIARNSDTVFRANETKLFVTEGASGGAKWRKLSKAYAERKAALGAGVRRRNRALTIGPRERPVSQKILRISENLMRSLTVAGHPEHIAQAEGAAPRVRVVLGTSNVLATYHHDGIPSNAGPVVRDPIAITAAQKVGLLVPARTYMLAKVRTVIRSARALRVHTVSA